MKHSLLFMRSLYLFGAVSLCLVGTALFFSCGDLIDSSKIVDDGASPQWPVGVWQFKDHTGRQSSVTIYRDGSALAFPASKQGMAAGSDSTTSGGAAMPKGEVLQSNVNVPSGDNFASIDAMGSWYFSDGRLYIMWMNGWTTVIAQQGENRYSKYGYAPGVSTDSSPTDSSAAEKISDALPQSL
jgi:hypothetical protein